MDNSDPVSLGAYWLHASLIPPAQPMAGAAAVSDVGMKGAERGEVGREREVKAEKKMATRDVGRGGKRGVTRMEMWKKKKAGDVVERKTDPL